MFKQAYPAEGMDSTVLLQRFLTGLQAPIARQLLLIKRPDSLPEAIKDAVAIEYALHYDKSIPEAKTDVPQADPINMLKSSMNHEAQSDEYTKLQKTVDALAKQLESLETNLRKSQPLSPGYQYRTPRQNQGSCRV